MNHIPTFYIDGTDYTLPCALGRQTFKRESQNSGYLMNRRYNADYLGTYVKYNVQLVIPKGYESEYDNLHYLLSSPNKEYAFTFPYGQSTESFDGIIDGVSDEFYGNYADIGGNAVFVWRRISFTVTSIEPVIEVIDE